MNSLPPAVEEADDAAYTRKWEGTLAVHGDYFPKLVWVQLSQNAESASIITAPNSKSKTVPPDFRYYRIKAGWYYHRDTWVCISKLITKTFNIGLNQSSHQLSCYDPLTDCLVPHNNQFHIGADYITPPVINVAEALRSFGAISSRLFLGKSKLFYLNMPIGLREGRTIFLASPEYEIEVHEAMKGVPCEIQT